MADESNIIIKITSETDLNDAQLQMRELKNREKELAAEMAKLEELEKRAVSTAEQLVRERKVELSYLERTKAKAVELKKAKQEDITAVRRSIEAINKEVKAYNLLQNAGNKMTMQLRQMREQLQHMEDAGETGSQAFIELSVAAARLQDQMGDTQEQIRILASDTKNLDAAMSVGQGLAGSFNLLTSSIALLGGESEALEKAFYKVQNAISVINGLQEIANVLNKDSAANVVIRTALTKKYAAAQAEQAVATGTATIAQRALNVAMKANPVGMILVAISAVVAVFTIFSDKVELIGRKLADFGAKIVGIFAPSIKYAHEAKRAMEEYERTADSVNKAINRYDILHAQNVHKIEKEERAAHISNAKRHATTMEQYKTDLKFLKQKQVEIADYTNKAIEANNIEIRAAKKARDAQKASLDRYTEGTKKYDEEKQKLIDKEKTYYDLVSKGLDLENQRRDADDAVAEKEQQIADERIRLAQQAQQARIDIMRDGAEKEKAQIELSYEDQLREAGKGTALYKALEEKKNYEIAEVDRKYYAQSLQEYADYLRNQSEADQFNIEAKEAYYNADAQAKVAALNKNEMSEEAYANAVKQIQIELNNNLKQLTDQRTAYGVQALQRELNQAQDALERLNGGPGTIKALEALYDAQKALYDAQEQQAREQYAAGIISYEDYQDRLYEASKNRADAELALEQDKMNHIADAFSQAIDRIGAISDSVFEALGNNIQAQMDALDEMYTTDAQEAKENADKKYITEKELAKKKAALELKQQKLNKASALFKIGLDTASAIMGFLVNPGGYPGIALAATAGVMGAVQLGVASAKPLPQYAKGRKGGQGEYALVGEKGPEIMYIPQGASIVPNDKLDMPEQWKSYGVPQLPNIDNEVVQQYVTQQIMQMHIDYDRLGKAVAANIPAQRAVTVNVDKSGIRVSNGRDTRTYLNQKYTGTWN